MNGSMQNGQPISGQPMNGQPWHGKPTGGQPMNGQPPHGQPMNGQPPYNQQMHRRPRPSRLPDRYPIDRPRSCRGPITLLVLLLLALTVAGLWWLGSRDGGSGNGGSGSGSGSGPSSGKLRLGTEERQAKETIPESGGVIEIDDAESPIDGLRIEIPEGAYSGDTSFEISTSTIERNGLGSLVEPVTPLITVENGHAYAAQPMIVTIPVALEDDEFAMGFFYDRETGELEAMPLLGEDGESVTVLTHHFSDFLVSKVRTDRILDKVETAFKTARDEVLSPNYGTVLCPNGHCAGQSAAAITYFMNAGRIGWDKPLYYRFDNNDKGATAFFYEDDAQIQRFCSVVHKHMMSNWTNTNAAFLRYRLDMNASDRHTFYAFAYAMQTTGMPQLLFVAHSESWDKTEEEKKTIPADKLGAHMVVCYGIEDSSLMIADPNYPGDTRKVEYSFGKRTKDRTIEGDGFKPYSSAPTADAAGYTEYDVFGFMGTSAVVDMKTVTADWLDLMENGGRTRIDPMFPADVSFDFPAGVDENGNPLRMPLLADTTVSEEQLVDAVGDRTLKLSPTTANAADRFSVYVGDKLQASMSGADGTGAQMACPLTTGLNDVGVLWQSVTADGGLDIVNFYRFRVTVGEAPTPTPAETTEAESTASGWAGNWRVTYTITDECSHGQGIAATAHNLPFVDANHLNVPYTADYSLAEANFEISGSTVLVHVPMFDEFLLTGTPSADGTRIEGTFKATWMDTHWGTGTFSMVRVE